MARLMVVRLRSVRHRVVSRRAGVRLKIGLGSCAGREQGQHDIASASNRKKACLSLKLTNVQQQHGDIHVHTQCHVRSCSPAFAPIFALSTPPRHMARFRPATKLMRTCRTCGCCRGAEKLAPTRVWLTERKQARYHVCCSLVKYGLIPQER